MSEKKSSRVRRQPERLEVGGEKQKITKKEKTIQKEKKAKEAYMLVLQMDGGVFLDIIPVNKLTESMRKALDNKSEFLTSGELKHFDNLTIKMKLVKGEFYEVQNSKSKYNITRYYQKEYED